MLLSIEAENAIEDEQCYVKFDNDTITECPLCHKSFVPDPLYAYIYNFTNKEQRASIVFFCRDCKSMFLGHYIIVYSDYTQYGKEYTATQFLSIEPTKFNKHIFDDNIIKLSPQFDKIYNQALAAELSGLDEIAGLGYRKSLEFLIKDFAIHEHPDSTEDIKKLPLSQCIKQYISDDRIKTLAERSAWIGNDEAHYLRKQTDRDVNDMKSFIKAIVYFIGMLFITEDAASMNPVK
jgi:hypothetical protein